jgi:hypothetical protein
MGEVGSEKLEVGREKLEGRSMNFEVLNILKFYKLSYCLLYSINNA